jgi:cytochrome P450
VSWVRQNRPPGPRGHWLSGNVVEYDQDRAAFLRRHHETYGDIFSFADGIVLNKDPRVAHEILAATNRDYLTELPPFAGKPDLAGASAAIAPWMLARRAIRPALTGDAMDGRIVDILARGLTATRRREVDVLPLMLDIAAHTVTELCLGSDGAGIPALLGENLAAARPFEEMDYQLPAWLPLPRNRRLFRVHRRTVDTLTRLVANRRAADDHGTDLLGVLLAADLSPRAVTTTVRGVLLGGHGVPAAALTSIVRELARRPDLTADLADEAGAGTPVANLPLAGAVVRETLRLCPPVWMMTRVALTGGTLDRWSLAPGDEVLTSPYLIHRDPRWWPRAEEFDPHRWFTERPVLGTYLPFGAGPRYCVGATLAMRQLTLSTSLLAQRFRPHAPAAADAEPDFRGRLAPAGLRATFG